MSTRRSSPRRTPRWGSLLAVLGAAAALVAVPAEALAAPPSPSPTPSSGAPDPRTTNTGRATFGIQPSTARGPDFRPYFVYSVTDGAEFQDHVAVVNYSFKPLKVRVYASDAYNDTDGTFSLPPRGTRPKDTGSWLKVGTSYQGVVVDVPARAFKVVPFSGAVPGDASPGDHAAGIIASLVVRSAGQGANIELDQRIATRTYFRVAGELRPQLRVEDLRGQYRGSWNPLRAGTTRVRYRLHNTGNVTLGGAQTVGVHGPFGLLAREAHPADAPLLLPGGVLEVTKDVPGTWPLLLMHSRAGIEASGLKDQGGRAVSYSAEVGFLAVPWSALLCLVAIVLGVWLVRRSRRQGSSGGGGKHARRGGPTPQPQAPAAPPLASLRTASIALIAGLLAVAAPAPASAETLPYVDPNVTGSVGLCDAAGNNVLSGHVTDKPFVIRAVGTTAAPPPYDQPGRTAILAAYQPRKGVDPGEWSGYTVVTASGYTNPKHPMVQGSAIGGSLQEFLGRYPPQWDGLVQLRMILGGTERSPKSDVYDATDLRIKGDTWTVVRGGTGPCRDGEAQSRAAALNLPGARAPIPTASRQAPPPVASTPEPVLTGAAAQSAAAALDQTTAGRSGTGSSDTTSLVVGALVLVVVAVGGTLGVLRLVSARRR